MPCGKFILAVWDVRQGNKCVATSALPDKVFTMSTTANRIVVGTCNRHVWVFDYRNLSAPEQKRESALKFQTRSLRCFPNGRYRICHHGSCRQCLRCILTKRPQCRRVCDETSGTRASSLYLGS